MKEKLSVRKVYRNAYLYVKSHLFAFFFLTFFYFIGSLFPLFMGTSSLFVVSTFYNYLFFYFAAGCYYKQQILWDRHIFLVAGLRFLTAIVLFLIALLITTLIINSCIHFVRLSFNGGLNNYIDMFLDSNVWLVGKYICIFLLFNIFFLIPSFAFVSEITGKNRSLLMTYAKTKGNFLKIALVTAFSVVLLVVGMSLLTFANIFWAALGRAAVLVFISILYFKMYDFFYSFPIRKVKEKNENTLVAKSKASKNLKVSDDMEEDADVNKR